MENGPDKLTKPLSSGPLIRRSLTDPKRPWLDWKRDDPLFRIIAKQKYQTPALKNLQRILALHIFGSGLAAGWDRTEDILNTKIALLSHPKYWVHFYCIFARVCL